MFLAQGFKIGAAHAGDNDTQPVSGKIAVLESASWILVEWDISHQVHVITRPFVEVIFGDQTAILCLDN